MRSASSKVAVALIAVALAGCGDSQSADIYTGTAAAPAAATSSGQLISGRLNLGVPITNAQITAESTSGVVLARTSLSNAGDFAFGPFATPSDFRIVAQVGQARFATEVRGHDGGNRSVVINVPTSLASLLLRSNPGLGLSGAEARIRTALDMESDRSLEYGASESLSSHFSQAAFLAAAADAGGWSNLAQEVANRGGTVEPIDPYRLTRAILDKDLYGLEPELQAGLTAYLQTPATRRSLNSLQALTANPLRTLTGPAASLASSSTQPRNPKEQVRGKIGSSIVEASLDTVAGLPAEQLIDIGWTHVADALNLNYGTTRMLEVIQEQLTEMLGLLENLSQQMAIDDLQLATDTIGQDVATIQTLTNNLRSANSSTISSPGTPYTPPDAVTNLIGSLTSFAAETAVQTISNILTGQGGGSNLIASNRKQVNTTYGIQDGATWGNAPFRANSSTLAGMISTFDYYANVQSMGLNVVGETSHVASTNAYDNMQSAVKFTDSAIVDLKKQRGQLPLPLPSNDIIVDLQSGTMWYWQNQGARPYQEAEDFADSWSVDVGNGVVYDDWRLPTEKELYVLQDRARVIPAEQRDPSVKHDGNDSSEGNYGYSSTGLPALGFDSNTIRALSSDAKLWCNPWKVENGEWTKKAEAFQFNHEHNNLEPGKSDSHGFLLVRNIAEPVVIEGDGVNDSNGTYGHPFEGHTLKPNEFYFLGKVTGLSDVRNVNGVADAAVDFSLTIGGSFEVGSSEEGDSYDFEPLTYTQKGLRMVGSGATNLQQVIWFEAVANAEAVTFGYDGELSWHNDTPGASYHVSTVAHTVAATEGSALEIIDSSAGDVNDTPPVRQLTAVQMFPRNRDYDMTVAAANNERYYALAYYSDGSFRDVTSQATWSVAQQSGQASQAASFSVSQPNELIYTDTATELLNVSATFGGLTDVSSARVYND